MYKEKMGQKFTQLLGILTFILFFIFVASEAKRLSPCKFPQIINFGDSNSDTGDYDVSNASWALGKKAGVSLPGKIKRLNSDGRLIIDFFTEKMRRPYLPSAYIDKNTTNFKNGINFAVGGSTITEYIGWKPPYYFPNQIAEFTEFKACTINLQGKAERISRLPTAKDFSKALYTIDIGQNDITKIMYGFSLQKDIADLMLVLQEGIKNLYNEGARFFWIHNTGPHGCLAFSPKPYLWISTDVDEYGCNKQFNDVASEFNKKLKEKVLELRAELQEAVITYVDVFTAKYQLFSNAKNLGFTDPLGQCKDGNVTCADPSKYIIWDGRHYTEAANRLVAQTISDGALSDPPLPITHACYRYETA